MDTKTCISRYYESSYFIRSYYPEFFIFSRTWYVKSEYIVSGFNGSTIYSTSIVDFILENNLVGKPTDEVTVLWKLAHT